MKAIFSDDGILICAALVLLGLSFSVRAQQASEQTSGTDIAAVRTAYTCEDAEKIKFDKAAFVSLDPSSRVLVDAQWQKCDFVSRQQKATAARPAPDSTVVVFTNPVATNESDKVFYGLIKRNDLENAEKNCAGAGKVGGVALTVAGAVTGSDATGQLGSAVFEYSGVSCHDLKGAVEDGNVMVLLAPHEIVRHAIDDKLTDTVLRNVPLVSGADKKNIEKFLEKATRPPAVTVGNHNVTVSTPVGKLKVHTPW